MENFDELIFFLALLVIIICFGIIALLIYMYRRRQAVIIDEFRDLANKADRELKKSNNKTDKEIYRAYKFAFIKAIDITKQGML